MSGRPSSSAVGRAGEEAAAAFLIGQGYRVLARNIRFRGGELDMVAEHLGVLVFVEVKTRISLGFGTAAEAVTPQKQRKLVRLAGQYLSGCGLLERPCRFDVVTVEATPTGQWSCQLIQDAFHA